MLGGRCTHRLDCPAQPESVVSVSKVILDTDPGIDDALALLFLAASPALELLAVTTVHGNAGVDITTRNALYLTWRFGIEVPVHRGASKPLDRPENPPATMVHGHNALGDVPLEPPPIRAAATPAYQAIIDLARSHPGEITLIAIGPLTNLALALQADPGIADLFKQVVIMGGAFGFDGVYGNVTPLAEANIYNDPEAAQCVFAAGWPLTVVSLDVTAGCVMSPEYIATIGADAGEAGRFIAQISEPYIAFYRGRDHIDGCCMHDAAAVGWLIAPHLFETVRGSPRADTEGEARGRTTLADAGPVARITASLDNPSLLTLFAATLRAAA